MKEKSKKKHSIMRGAQWAGMMAMMVACGKGPTASGPLQVKKGAILGGQEVEKKTYTNVVALTATKMGFFCTGTLIAPKVVLTAAHCVEAVPAMEMQVYFGEGSELKNYQGEIEVERTLAHDDYNFNTRSDSDVGLVFLKEEAPKNIVPATILSDYAAIQDLRDKNISNITLVGFGRTNADLSVDSGGAKRYVDVPLLEVTRKEIKVGNKAPLKGACKGDSGGPAFVNVGDKQFLVGVTSRAAGQNLCEDGTAYYGLAPSHLCWIEKEAGVSVGAENLGCSNSVLKKGKMNFAQACRAPTNTYVAQTAYALKRAVGAKTCDEAYSLLQQVKNLDLRNRDLRDLSLLSEFKQIESVQMEGNPVVELDSIRNHPGIKDIYVDGTDLPEGGILLMSFTKTKNTHFQGSILMDMFLQEKTYYVDFFLGRGADVNWQDEDGHTVMHASLAWGDSDSFQKFLDNGGNVDIVDKTGDNLLFFAKKEEDFKKIIELSKDATKLVNQQNDHGMTPLFKAITFGDLELVKHMVEDLGANLDPNPENPMMSPRFFALYIGQVEIWKYIYEKLTGESVNVGGKPVEPIDASVFKVVDDLEKLRYSFGR